MKNVSTLFGATVLTFASLIVACDEGASSSDLADTTDTTDTSSCCLVLSPAIERCRKV